MAGFIASAERWAAFSDEWSQVLDMERRIEHFKMNDAMKLNGEFRGWRKEARDEKLKLLMRGIAEHVSAHVACVIRRDQYELVFRSNDLPKQFWSPYYFLLYGVIGEVANNQHKLGLEGAIDFFFDEQVMQKDKVIGDWDIFKLAHPELLHLIGQTPAFRDDKCVKPLQAADMLAWIARKQAQNSLRGLAPIRLPAFDCPTLEFIWNEKSLQDIRNEMRRTRPIITATWGQWTFSAYD